MMIQRSSSHSLRKKYLDCCFYEIKINKPGNVSIFSPILGMDKKKFFYAAEISSHILCNKSFSLGESIFKSCKICMRQINSNYNLGIILLCAPIIRAAYENFNSLNDFHKNISKQLKNISSFESEQILEAIKICKPAGLKNYSGEGNLLLDENKELGFQEIMEISSERDRISRAYVNNFSEIFDQGLPFFRNLRKKFSKRFSTECLFMYYLSSDLDSHLQRKYGMTKAMEVQKKSKIFSKKVFLKEDLKSTRCLDFFDNYLKKKKNKSWNMC